MFNRIITGRGLGRSFVLAGVIAGSAVAGLASAIAGECPADKMPDRGDSPLFLGP